MANVYEVWGFGRIVTLSPDDGTDRRAKTLAALNAGAADRGIATDSPSDALDLSRDLIITEAVGLGEWEIVDGTLYVVYDAATPVKDLIAAHADPYLV